MPAPLTHCPRCGCRTVHIDEATSTFAGITVLAALYVWCENCDDNEHPLERATD